MTEKIELKQHGVIEINFENEQTFIHFNEIFEKLKRLLEISTRRRINVEAVSVYSHEIFDNYGDRNIERNIKVYCRMRSDQTSLLLMYNVDIK